MSGIKVGLRISGEACPVVQESKRSDTAVKEINKTAVGDDDFVIEEIVFDDVINASNDSFDELFSSGDLSIYRYNRPKELTCACDQVEESLQHPISNIRIQNDSLYVTVHIEEIEDLQTLIEKLQTKFNNASVCKIEHSDIKKTEDTMAFNRDELTKRQQEVYRTAFEMGYFEHDSGANASKIADELGIAVSTFREHMKALHRKMARSFFNGGNSS